MCLVKALSWESFEMQIFLEKVNILTGYQSLTLLSELVYLQIHQVLLLSKVPNQGN